MEGVGASPFRKAMAEIGGFDEATTEFLRVPSNAHVYSLAKKYQADETFPIPQAAQIMGSDPELMADMTECLIQRGAPRIDLNCGCPSNRVTGRGAGSTLLKTPELLNEIATKMVQRSSVPVSIKMRTGFSDTSLLVENLHAAQESGAAFITLHHRTRVEGYSPPIHWERLAFAKSILRIPLVGSGDVVDRASFDRMCCVTGVDGVMIGRGALANPWVFHEIRETGERTTEGVIRYLQKFFDGVPSDAKERSRINQLKQIVSFLLEDPLRKAVLTSKPLSAKELLDFTLNSLSAIR